MRFIFVLAAVAAILYGGAAEELPYVARDDAGNLVVYTAPNASLIVNGVPITGNGGAGSGADNAKVAALEARIAQLEARLAAGAADTTIVAGQGASFLSREKQWNVTEASSSWSVTSLSIFVGDRVQWTWSGFDSVFQVASSSSPAPVAGGISSGNVVLAGNFTHRFTAPGTYYFRSANKGYPLTVNVSGFGIGTGALSYVVGGCVQRRGCKYDSASYCQTYTSTNWDSFYLVSAWGLGQYNNSCSCLSPATATTIRSAIFDAYTGSNSLYRQFSEETTQCLVSF